MKTKFKAIGTGVAIVTPFNKQNSIDFTALQNLIEHLITNGTDYIVAMGTTSEAVTLSSQEKVALMDFIIDVVDNRVPIVMGIGGNNTYEVLETIDKTDLSAISGILSVVPYYNKPSQKGIYKHFKAIAEVSPVPIILYNVPGRTGTNMTAETCLQLANEFPNIIGVKEASGNMDQAMNIMMGKPANFQLISGEDALVLPLMSIGATGVISVSANAYPDLMSSMVNLALKHDYKKARPIHYKLLPFSNAIFEEGNPAGIKAALELKSLISNNLRLPLVKVSMSLINKLDRIIKAIEA